MVTNDHFQLWHNPMAESMNFRSVNLDYSSITSNLHKIHIVLLSYHFLLHGKNGSLPSTLKIAMNIK